MNAYSTSYPISIRGNKISFLFLYAVSTKHRAFATSAMYVGRNTIIVEGFWKFALGKDFMRKTKKSQCQYRKYRRSYDKITIVMSNNITWNAVTID